MLCIHYITRCALHTLESPPPTVPPPRCTNSDDVQYCGSSTVLCTGCTRDAVQSTVLLYHNATTAICTANMYCIFTAVSEFNSAWLVLLLLQSPRVDTNPTISSMSLFGLLNNSITVSSLTAMHFALLKTRFLYCRCWAICIKEFKIPRNCQNKTNNT